MIAGEMRDEDGELHYADFNAFLQVNRALFCSLNLELWKEPILERGAKVNSDPSFWGLFIKQQHAV
jgi:hypothetical protein